MGVISTTFKAVGATAAAVVAVPIGWGLYVYGQASRFAFKHYKATIVAGLAAGGIYYAANNEGMQEKIAELASSAQATYYEQRIDGLEEKIIDYQEENSRQRQTLINGGQLVNENSDFWYGVGAGGLGTLTVLGLYGGAAKRARKKPKPRRVRVIRNDH